MYFHTEASSPAQPLQHSEEASAIRSTRSYLDESMEPPVGEVEATSGVEEVEATSGVGAEVMTSMAVATSGMEALVVASARAVASWVTRVMVILVLVAEVAASWVTRVMVTVAQVA